MPNGVLRLCRRFMHPSAQKMHSATFACTKLRHPLGDASLLPYRTQRMIRRATKAVVPITKELVTISVSTNSLKEKLHANRCPLTTTRSTLSAKSSGLPSHREAVCSATATQLASSATSTPMQKGSRVAVVPPGTKRRCCWRATLWTTATTATVQLVREAAIAALEAAREL